MFDIQQIIGRQSLPSTLKDPFSKVCIKNITVIYREDWGGNWVSVGWVEFKNGDTIGKQEFKGESFDIVVGLIKTFIEQELKK